jgi:hypothetical protein
VLQALLVEMPDDASKRSAIVDVCLRIKGLPTEQVTDANRSEVDAGQKYLKLPV